MYLCLKWITVIAVMLVSTSAGRGFSDNDVIWCRGKSCSACKCCRHMRDDVFPNLEIEFNCTFPDVVRIIQPPADNQSQHFTLFASNSCITRLPENICDYPNIVSIKLDAHSIESIPSLSCLTNLVALDLSRNYIEAIESGTFKGLRRLRLISLHDNRISTIGVNTFVSDLVSLQIVRLDSNHLTTAEAGWIMRIGHSFCVFNLSHNKISRLSNVENWTVNRTETYGPGFVDFSHNLFSTWITSELSRYGFSDLTVLGMFMAWGFDFRHNILMCDCKMYSFIALAKGFIEVLWRNYFEVYCHDPPELDGRLIIDLSLADLVCNVSDKCPSSCLCQDQPDAHRMLVDCRHGNLRRLPRDLPPGDLHLLLENNSITALNARPFLSRTRYLDMSNNGLRYVESLAIAMLRNGEHLDLSHNQLHYLPENIVTIPFASLDVRNNPLACSCNTTWMASWLRLQLAERYVTNLTCRVDNRTAVPAFKADDQFLHCRKPNPFPTVMSILLGILVTTFVAIAALFVVFRYELIILTHICLKNLGKPSLENLDYDVFVSADNDSELDRVWSGKTLLPEMEQNRGLRLYFPPRDMDPGSVIVEETINVLKKCRTVLVVLSANYLENPSKIYEFSEAYNIMVRQRRGRILLLRAHQVHVANNGFLNGFLRLKKYLDLEDPSLFGKIACQVENTEISENCYTLFK